MKIAFLINSIEPYPFFAVVAACSIPQVAPVMVLVKKGYSIPESPEDRQLVPWLRPGFLEQWKGKIADLLEGHAKAVSPHAVAAGFLRKAFPERVYNLTDLSCRYGCSIVEVDDYNSHAAQDALRNSGADLAIVLGKDLPEATTSSIPALGTIVVDQEGACTLGGAGQGGLEPRRKEYVCVSVHFAGYTPGRGLQLARGTVVVHALDTVSSLQVKLAMEGAAQLGKAVALLAAKGAVPVTSEETQRKPAQVPASEVWPELVEESRFAKAPPLRWRDIVKTTAYLGIYHLGAYALLRFCRRSAGSSRAVILLFHRVNDFSLDPLTTSTADFAAILATIARYYQVRSTGWLVEQLKQHRRIPPDTLAIHFDDSYRDMFTNALPLLEAAGFPATFFLSSGYIDTDKPFSHDEKDYPFVFENLSSDHVADIAARGFEVAAHTVNHVDLGSVSIAEAEQEVLQSRLDLEAIIGLPVRYFSFPFGKPENIIEPVRTLIMDAGFEALFSAYGGVVGRKTCLSDIPRRGVSSSHRPLDLLMEIEGISLGDIAAFFRSVR